MDETRAVRFPVEMLIGNVVIKQPDYKIGINEELEPESDYFWNQISSLNKDETAVASDSSLVYCELDANNKIVLNPFDSGGSTGNNYDIIVDSFKIVESTHEMPLQSTPNKTPVVVLPIQLASGTLKSIKIMQSLQQGKKLEQVHWAIYANSTPSIDGARLLYESHVASGAESVYVDGVMTLTDEPEIEGVDPGTNEPNTFMYLVLCACGNDDGGYKLLGRKNENLSLLSALTKVTVCGKVTNFNGTFPSVFNLTVDDNAETLSNLIIPYVSFVMTV